MKAVGEKQGVVGDIARARYNTWRAAILQTTPTRVVIARAAGVIIPEDGISDDAVLGGGD